MNLSKEGPAPQNWKQNCRFCRQITPLLSSDFLRFCHKSVSWGEHEQKSYVKLQGSKIQIDQQKEHQNQPIRKKVIEENYLSRVLWTSPIDQIWPSKICQNSQDSKQFWVQNFFSDGLILTIFYLLNLYV